MNKLLYFLFLIFFLLIGILKMLLTQQKIIEIILISGSSLENSKEFNRKRNNIQCDTVANHLNNSVH